jgi:hypothetical protein
MRRSSSGARARLSSAGCPPATSRPLPTPRTALLIRRSATSFPTNSPTPPSPLLPFLYARRRLGTTSLAVARTPAAQWSTEAPTGAQSDESAVWENEQAQAEVAESGLDGSSDYFSAVLTSEGQHVLQHILQGRAAEAEAALRDLVAGPDAMLSSANEIKQLTEAVLELVLYPSAAAEPSSSTDDVVASGSSSHSRVEQADPESSTHYGSTLTRRAIRLLHFLRVHGQPRSEAMYGALIRRILDQGHVDLAARVYVELVEEWAWEQKRAAGRAAGIAHAGDDLFDAIEEEVGWLRKVEWVDPVKEDVWAFEKWRRGPEAAEEDLPGQPFEQARFELFRERRRKEAEAAALQGAAEAETASEVEIAQHKLQLEQDAPFNGFFGGLRWNHRAEAQRRTLCWAPSPSRLRLYLRRFPPSVSRVPKAARSTSIPFPSMALLNPILERAAGNLTSLSPYGAFVTSASALAIIANTVHSRTLPLSHLSVLIRTFESLPQFPRVHAPLPSPDPVDDTTAFTHVQSALASLIYGLPPGSMGENVERFGLNSISEGSANSLLSYSLGTLRSPAKGEKVLSYMRCQGYLNSPASTRETGQVLIKAGLRSKIWRYFVDGFQMTVGEMAGAFVRFVHERPVSPEALRVTRGSQWRPEQTSLSDHAAVAQLELPEHPITPLAVSGPEPGVRSPENGEEKPSASDVDDPHATSEAEASPQPLPPSPQDLWQASSAEDAALFADMIDSFPFPAQDELGPDASMLFQSYLQSPSAYDPPAAATALLRYAADARRFDLILQMHNYLLGTNDRPVQMTAELYRALIIPLRHSGYHRTAEHVFCLARKELTAQGLELDVDLYGFMLKAYADDRSGGVDYVAMDGHWSPPRAGKIYPGDEDPADRALRRGWALYRGAVWGHWQHWDPLQARILRDETHYPLRRWFIEGPQQSPPTLSPANDPSGEPDFRPPHSADLPQLFNAAIRLLRMQKGMTELPRHVLRSRDLLKAMIATVKKKALNVRRADAPELVGADLCLSLIALDIRRAGFLVPLGVELLLARYPQHHERIQQVQPIRPLSALQEAEADFFYAYSTEGAFMLPRDVRGSRRRRKEPSEAFDSREMDQLGLATSYPAGSFDDCDISPSDWPLLVWAALEGRAETDFNLPPGIWDAALELKDNFAIAEGGQYLLLVGRFGEPVPFVPSRNRDEFIQLNMPPELLGRKLSPHDTRPRLALSRAGWWPNMRRDLRERFSAAWRERQLSPEYQADLASRVDDVVLSGARREDPADQKDEADDSLSLEEEEDQPLPGDQLLPPSWAAGLAASGLPPLPSQPPGKASALPPVPPRLAAPPTRLPTPPTL